jgi:hypothetical protein
VNWRTTIKNVSALIKALGSIQGFKSTHMCLFRNKKLSETLFQLDSLSKYRIFQMLSENFAHDCQIHEFLRWFSKNSLSSRQIFWKRAILRNLFDFDQTAILQDFFWQFLTSFSLQRWAAHELTNFPFHILNYENVLEAELSLCASSKKGLKWWWVNKMWWVNEYVMW